MATADTAQKPTLYLNKAQPHYQQILQACPHFEQWVNLVTDPYALDDDQPMPQLTVTVSDGTGQQMRLSRTGVAKVINFFKNLEKQQQAQTLQQQVHNGTGGNGGGGGGGGSAPHTPNTSSNAVVDSGGAVLGGRINFSVTPPGGYSDDKVSPEDIARYVSERQREDAKLEDHLKNKHV